MQSHKSLIFIGIAFSVIPSTICIFVGEAFNLSNPATITQSILIALPAMIAIGALIGLGVSLLRPNVWLVSLGSGLGWFVGLVTSAAVSLSLGLPRSLAYLLIVVSGVLAGLLPTLIVRVLKGAR
jgi:hypothetical protein